MSNKLLVIEDTVCDNDLTKKEILERCIVDYTDNLDFFNVIDILVKNFKIPSVQEAIRYAFKINIDLENSVKYYDPETGDVYGLLLVADNKVTDAIPHLQYRNPLLPAFFKSLKQKEGVAFILDKRVRGVGLDQVMLQTYKDTDDYQEKDIMWCGVQHELKSHEYWKKNGFIKFFSDPAAKFYLKMIE